MGSAINNLPVLLYRLVWLRCGNIANRGLRTSLEVRWPEVQRRLDECDALAEVG